MVGLVVADTVVVLLLGLLVAGLLRSHADIARKLRELGVPLGDPAREPRQAVPIPAGLRRAGDGTVEIGPPLPHRSVRNAVFDVEGVTPEGDSLALAVLGARKTLLCFLSSGCAGCGAFWADLDSGRSPIPGDVRTVVVTKGPETEQVGAVRRLSPEIRDVPIVMSSQAWQDYEVPGSPFFVLVDGEAGGRLGEGTARSLAEVAELVLASIGDAGISLRTTRGETASPETGRRHRDHVPTVDEQLVAAGIGPGDASLYPASVKDILQPRGAGAPCAEPAVPLAAPPRR